MLIFLHGTVSLSFEGVYGSNQQEAGRKIGCNEADQKEIY